MAKNPMNDRGGFRANNTVAPPVGSGGVLGLFNNKGKTAIVTGASGPGGIGIQVARALAETGANVAIWYNSNKKAIELAADIEKQYGVQCRAYQVNVTDPGHVQQSVDQIVKEFNGRLDVFVANAGVTWQQGPAIDGKVDHYRKVVTTDLDSVFYTAQAAGKHFCRQKDEGTDLDGKKLEHFVGGSFIATASMSGHIANIPQMQAAYNAAKAGVMQLCKSLAVEWARFARVNTISPGYVNTEISDFVPKETQAMWNEKIPMGRPCEPHELQGAYLYLASDVSSYTTGTDILVDGGYCAV